MRRALASMTAVVACVVLWGCGGESPSGRRSPVAREVAESPPVRSGGMASHRGAESEATVAYDMEEAFEAGDAVDRMPAAEPAGAASGPMPVVEKRGRADSRAAAEDASPAEARAPRRDPGPDPPRIRKSQIQSGTLTAGSFDDNERFDDYQQFLSEVMQEDAEEKLPRLAIGRRVMIQVRDRRGAPVGDARVVVRQGRPRHELDEAEARVLLELTTASDGRVMFLTGRDGAGSVGEFLVTVHPPDQGEPVTQEMHVGQGPWQITLPEARAKLPRRLDLALVIDTTGSMSDELEYLKVEIDSIAKTIYQMFPKVDQRYSLVVYRDDGDQYVTRTFDFTASLAEFRATLSEQSANGGGNYPEAMHLALESAEQLDWRDEESARVLFLVADAPPHDRFAQRTLDAVEGLRTQGVRVFPAAASGTATKAEFVMRAAGFLTLGQYLFLTDHSGVGNAHAEPHVPDYQVERLDRLMIRMIASELAGRRLAADEVIAIESGDLSVPEPDEGPIPVEQQQQHAPISAASSSRAPLAWVPRWAILLAALVGLCLADSLLSRNRS